MAATKKRCSWVNNDPVYIQYHDEEWGVPIYDDLKLFEFLILEGAQAGLSWITILKRRDNYRQAFDGFNPEKIALYDDKKRLALINDVGIIRNRLKIEAATINAKAYLKVRDEWGCFSDYMWQFVNGKPIINHWQSASLAPARTKESDEMAKALKKQGFKFVGSTICYAFMQAVGMVNDHSQDCFLAPPHSHSRDSK